MGCVDGYFRARLSLKSCGYQLKIIPNKLNMGLWSACKLVSLQNCIVSVMYVCMYVL